MHVIDTLALGGAERMLVELANRATADGYQVSVCVTRDGCALATALRRDIPLLVLGRRRRFDLAAMWRFAAFVKAERVEVLHAHGLSTFSFLALLKIMCLIRQPIILHAHNGLELDTSIPSWFRLYGYRYIDHYVGVYSKMREWAEAAGLPASKISVIENALDLTRIQEALPLNIKDEYGIPDTMPVGIVVGNIRQEKGIDVLLTAIAQCSAFRAARVLIVGGYANKEYARACQTKSAILGLGDRVNFLGQRPDIPELLHSVDFALLPSRSESGPLVLIEYMVSGLPFVSTQVGGIAQRVANLGVPEFVPPDDADAFTRALDRLLSLSPSERRARGAAGRDVAVREFDIRNVMQQWYAIYGTVLNQ